MLCFLKYVGNNLMSCICYAGSSHLRVGFKELDLKQTTCCCRKRASSTLPFESVGLQQPVYLGYNFFKKEKLISHLKLMIIFLCPFSFWRQEFIDEVIYFSSTSQANIFYCVASGFNEWSYCWNCVSLVKLRYIMFSLRFCR